VSSDAVQATRRPLWRRLGAGVVAASGRLLTVAETLTRRHGDLLIPPAHLRRYYYRTFDPAAFERAGTAARTELMLRHLQPHHRLLDVGSGIGNLAVALLDYSRGGYDGLEIHAEAVRWCQSAITPRAPSFRFHHADVVNQAYNPDGREQPSTYRFTFADASFDFVFLGSVFTHLFPDAVANYLREVARVLTPGGTCVASYFLLNEERRAAVKEGRSFLSFTVADESRLFLLHDPAMPEAAVALDETFVRKAHESASLDIVDLRRGNWWNGGADDQDVITARRTLARSSG
jgi:SAM-dependent methyltransferase